MKPTWIGLDIGGANLKACDSTGRAITENFALYRNPEQLSGQIRNILGRLPHPHAVVVTMTAELCDCFVTRRQGVNQILDSLESVINPAITRIWGIDGKFHPISTIRQNPALAEASNWKALGDYIAFEFFDDSQGILIDLGSTTTDILAISQGVLLSQSKTDLDRLQTGELVYLGARRTPLSSVIAKVRFQKKQTSVMRELFATTADIYLTLGQIEEEPENLDTANGRPATRSEALHRLARMIGLDYEHFTESDAEDLAKQADKAICQILHKSLERVVGTLQSSKVEQVVVSGSGAFLASKIAGKMFPDARLINLDDLIGANSSSAACAYALVKLAERKLVI